MPSPLIRNELQSFELLRGLLSRVIADLHSIQAATPGLGVSESEHQRTFSRVSRFFDGLRQVTRRLREGGDTRFRSETEALLRACDAREGEPLLGWGLTFNNGCGWEVDFLGIDYQLRSHGDRVLASLELFAGAYLDTFLAQWRAVEVTRLKGGERRVAIRA